MQAWQKDFRAYSRAMYSNWLWHQPLQLLVDAGEGLQLALGNTVFTPSHLAITHGHSDHVLGLPGLLAARRFGKGAVDKPLTIIFPEGSRGVQGVRRTDGGQLRRRGLSRDLGAGRAASARMKTTLGLGGGSVPTRGWPMTMSGTTRISPSKNMRTRISTSLSAAPKSSARAMVNP